jgi:hypothetical protein
MYNEGHRKPSLIGSLRDLLHGESLIQDKVWLGFIVRLAFVSWGLRLPRIGAALSFHERKHVVDLLEQALVARQDPDIFTYRNGETSVDSWRVI